MSPRIRSAYDLYTLKKLLSKGRVSEIAIKQIDISIKELSDSYDYLQHKLNTLDSTDYTNNKKDIEEDMGRVEEMLEQVILTGLEILSVI